MYTGGTMGMLPSKQGYTPAIGYLAETLTKIIQFKHQDVPKFDFYEYEPLIDSSNVTADNWSLWASDIAKKIDSYDGFVIIHGTDSLAYTASALSFMLTNLSKPVVITGSQLPIANPRSDATENLVNSLYLAANKAPPEVTVCFNHKLFRGNRVTKINSDAFNAFTSPNFPCLAELGVNLTWNKHLFLESNKSKLKVFHFKKPRISTFVISPGCDYNILQSILKKPLDGLILQTYGSGNAPSNDKKFLELIANINQQGTIIVNHSQCAYGSVNPGKYETSHNLKNNGVISSGDMTFEATYCKLFEVLSHNLNKKQAIDRLCTSLVGELTNS